MAMRITVMCPLQDRTLTGELQSSDEGKVWWEEFVSISFKLATNDMFRYASCFWKMISVEFFYYKDGDDWLYDLK